MSGDRGSPGSFVRSAARGVPGAGLTPPRVTAAPGDRRIGDLGPAADDQEFLLQEFDRQARTLIEGGYPVVAGIDRAAFARLIDPLRARVEGLAAPDGAGDEGRIPFIIVVTSDLVPTEAAMALIETGGARGIVDTRPVDPRDFRPIDGVAVPAGAAFLLTDIDTGRSTLNVTPDDALGLIAAEGRSPLTIDEGVAVLTHFADVLKARNAFSLPGSRRSDRRVTALWISRGRPRLGWCWAGNPHTWLGSASCGGRIDPGTVE